MHTPGSFLRIATLAALAVSAVASCSSNPHGGDAGAEAGVRPVAHWELPRSGPNEFMLPWPSDVALTPTGHVNLRYVRGAQNNGLVRTYLDALDEQISGYSPVAAVYFRFSVPLDPASLPAAGPPSRARDASVQLVDVDPRSPERGQRQPLQFYFRGASTRYWTPNTLAVAPAFGFPLRPSTRYALVVTTRVRAMDGSAIARDADLDAVLAPTPSADAAVEAARALHAPVLTELAEAGVAREQILSLAVFTTQDPVSELFRAVRALRTETPEPAVVDMAVAGDGAGFRTFTGHYGPNPLFQSGDPPFDAPGSGAFVLDAMGVPQVQQEEQRITFALTVPTTGTMPASGWPIAIYAHGTGGSARSFINDGTAARLAAQGIAVFGIDQLFNGDRTVGGATAQMAEAQFFNFNNINAVRNNNRQAALDLVQASRLVRTLTVPAATSGGAAITFDASRLMFFGHSQGGLNGPLWLAAEDTARAAVLSGAGGVLTLAMTQKRQPVDIPQVIALALGISTSNPEELVPLHPIMTLAQTALDVADPVNYARYIQRQPREGTMPRHVFLTQGFVDNYTPPDSISALALAIGVQLSGPVVMEVAQYSLSGLEVAALPARLNVAGGQATGVWSQFMAPPRRDGHFVVFDVPTARARAAAFLGSYARGEAGGPVVSP